VPEDQAKKLDGLAEQLDRPRGWVVKEAVETYLALAEERRRETIAALEEVDAGRLVEHSEVEAWAAELGMTRKRKARAKRAG
jgi:predicted transcriptional regulator